MRAGLAYCSDYDGLGLEDFRLKLTLVLHKHLELLAGQLLDCLDVVSKEVDVLIL